MSHIWYFAYGSNMQAATFRGRRGIEWTRAVPVRVAGWRLVLDKPSMLGSATSFANIVPEPDAVTIGVAYELTPEDHAHVELTEGVMIGNYDRVEVDGVALDGSASLRCLSLHSPKRAPDRRPSARYMRLIIEGALEHRLPADYVEWLRAHPCDEETVAEQVLRAGLDAALHALRPGKKEPR